MIYGFLNAGRRSKILIGLNRITLKLKINNSWGIKVAVIHKANGYSYINPNLITPIEGSSMRTTLMPNGRVLWTEVRRKEVLL